MDRASRSSAERFRFASGLKPEGLKLGRDVERGDVLVACGRAAAVELVIGQKVHIRVNFTFERCRLSGSCVERLGLLPMSREGEGKSAYKRGRAQAQEFPWIHCANYRGTLVEVVLRRNSPAPAAR
jgi:hypothetical protein